MPWRPGARRTVVLLLVMVGSICCSLVSFSQFAEREKYSMVVLWPVEHVAFSRFSRSRSRRPVHMHIHVRLKAGSEIGGQGELVLRGRGGQHSRPPYCFAWCGIPRSFREPLCSACNVVSIRSTCSSKIRIAWQMCTIAYMRIAPAALSFAHQTLM